MSCLRFMKMIKHRCNSIVNHFFSQFGAVFSYVIDIEFQFTSISLADIFQRGFYSS